MCALNTSSLLIEDTAAIICRCWWCKSKWRYDLLNTKKFYNIGPCRYDDDPDVAKDVDHDDNKDQLTGHVTRRDRIRQSGKIRWSWTFRWEWFKLRGPVAADGDVGVGRDVEDVGRWQDVVSDLQTLAWLTRLSTASLRKKNFEHEKLFLKFSFCHFYFSSSKMVQHEEGSFTLGTNTITHIKVPSTKTHLH